MGLWRSVMDLCLQSSRVTSERAGFCSTDREATAAVTYR